MPSLDTSRARLGFSSFWKELKWLSVALTTLAALAVPGLVAKTTGAIGALGADPAIHVGTVVFQTAPLVLAVATVAVGFPLLVKRLEDEHGPYWFGRWPFAALIEWGAITSVLLATTAAANALGMNSGIDLAGAWQEHPAPTFPLLADLVAMYLDAYGAAAFISAILTGAFLARWYGKVIGAIGARQPAEPNTDRASPEDLIGREDVIDSARVRGGSLMATTSGLLFLPDDETRARMRIPYATVRWADVAQRGSARRLQVETLDGDGLSFARVSPPEAAERICDLLNRRATEHGP